MDESGIPAEDLDGDMRETLVVRKWRAEQLRRLGVPSILAERSPTPSTGTRSRR
jgi:hypothetical protein